MTTAVATSLDLSGDVFDRIVGAVVDFTTLNTFGMPHRGGVPWPEFVKIQTTGTSVYAVAGDGASLAVARNDRRSEPTAFLLHAPDARELLAMDFERIEFTPHTDKVEVTVWRNRRPWLLELETRPADTFPSVSHLADAGFNHRGAAPVGLTARTLGRLHTSANRFGLEAGLVIYPQADPNASVVAAYRDELLLICSASDAGSKRTDPSRGWYGNGSGKRFTQVDPLEFWPTEITGGAW